MSGADLLVGNPTNDNSVFGFAKAGEIYLVYLPNGGIARSGPDRRLRPVHRQLVRSAERRRAEEGLRRVGGGRQEGHRSAPRRRVPKRTGSWSSANSCMTDTRKLRGVGIGAGYFAPFQYEAWTRIPEVEIVAIYNRTEERARPLMAQYGIARYYDDWKEMLDRERPDFVDIITPPETHEEMCAFAAARGIHIICQKPLAPDLRSQPAHRRRTAAERRRALHGARELPLAALVSRDQRASRSRGDIGEFTHVHFLMRMGDGWGADAYLARQPFFRDYPRLLFYETGVHFIDTFRFLLGEVSSVVAETQAAQSRDPRRGRRDSCC